MSEKKQILGPLLQNFVHGNLKEVRPMCRIQQKKQQSGSGQLIFESVQSIKDGNLLGGFKW